ncbi:hypothetical protein [Carnobacterium maltaromaticum]|uniref:hypothetical protein n=1 Tax=Carnobacterium maltaromaticum TaxID=2751 RepID=UPI0039B0F7E9
MSYSDEELEQLKSALPNQDPTPLGPKEEFFLSPMNDLVKEYAVLVRTKMFGQHVREALARGIEISSIDATYARNLADAIALDQLALRNEYAIAVAGLTVDSEVKIARLDMSNTIQTTLNDRLRIDFLNRMTIQEQINFLAGQDVEVTIKSDFNTPPKIAGSNVENGNIFKRSSSPTLQSPSGTWVENTQENYDSIMKLDESVSRYAYMTNGAIASKLISYNALWILEKNFPSIFKNAITNAEKVTIAKSKIKKFQYKGWAKASGPTGALCSHSMFNPISALWVATATSTGNSIIERSIGSANTSTPAYLNADGFYYFAVYAEPSDGTIASSVSIDYTSMELTVKFNINEFAVSPSQLEAMREDLQTKLDKLQTLVDTKQDKIVDSGILYPTLAGGAASHPAIQVRYRKIGKEVRWSGRATLPQTTLATQIASTPLAYAPGAELFFPLRVVGAQTDLVANILIKPDGSIWIYSSNNNVQFFSFDNLSYFID